MTPLWLRRKDGSFVAGEHRDMLRRRLCDVIKISKEIHIMSHDLTVLPEYRATMDRLKQVKRTAPDGSSYWMARDVYPILGYSSLPKFKGVIERAAASFAGNKVDPSHQIAPMSRVMGAGKGAQQTVDDYYLSHAACYLIALNGDPSKPEVAAAQAYFAIQTRRMEIQEERSDDARRVEEREKVSESFKRVSGTKRGTFLGTPGNAPNRIKGLTPESPVS